MKATHTWYTDDGEKHETNDAELMVSDRLDAKDFSARNEAIGRLVNLLLEKGVITPTECGWALFFEDWK